MALNKKSGHALDIEERLRKQLGVDESSQSEPETSSHAHTDTVMYTDTYGYTYKKEAKSKRLYLLAKPSVHQKLDEYAKKHGDSFNNLVHTLMEEFIDKNNL